MSDRTTTLLLGLAALAVLGLAVLSLAVGRAPAARVTVAGGGTVAEPSLRTSLRMAPYAVTGADAPAVLASMAREAPPAEGGVFFGLTTTTLSFRYDHRAAPQGCALANVRVDLAVTTALPEWTAPPNASYDLRRDWARFRAALERHEARHHAIGETGADEVLSALGGLSARTCAQADAEARRRAERTGIETDAAHRRYDEETGHGRTQGAVWPLQR